MKVLLSIIVAIGLYVGGLYVFQDNLIFHPGKHHKTPEMVHLTQFKEVNVTAGDGTELRFWYANGDNEKPAILFFHGNASQNAFFASHLTPFIDDGYAVLMPEYRGFGATEGKLRQNNVFNDAAMAFDWLKKQGYEQIVVYGYSFGCAVSLGLSSLRTPDKMILTAPFASLISLVKEKPVPLADKLLRDYYPSDEFIKKYHNPLLIIHGKEDKLIPYHHSEILYKKSGSLDKTLILMPDEDHKTIFMEDGNLPYIFNWIHRYY